MMSSSDEKYASDTSSRTRPSPLRLQASHVQVYPRAYPASVCENYCPLHPIVEELEALDDLKETWVNSPEVREASPGELSSGNGKEVIVFDLKDFSIYEKRGLSRDNPHEWDLSPLHRLNAQHKDQRSVCGTMRLTGNLCVGTTVRTVRDVTFDSFSVEGYDDPTDPSVTIFIQTQGARCDRTYDIWYRLKTPANEYSRYHHTFLWIAQFGKHFVDYLGALPLGSVELSNLEVDFSQWLQTRFRGNAVFDAWKTQYRGDDFRHAVNAYLGFLYNQAGTLDNSKELLTHPIWAECGSSDDNLDLSAEPTVITPFVHQFFKDIYFSKHLEELTPETTVAKRMHARQKALGFIEFGSAVRPQHKSLNELEIQDIKPGDVIGLRPDPNSCWRSKDAEWIAYVQGVEKTNRGTKLYVIYLYRPTDTTISDVWYQHKTELFFSDHCNCGECAFLEAVTRKYNVVWYPDSAPAALEGDFFVRQTYLSNENEFITLRDSHFVCRCRSSKENAVEAKDKRGDCVYIQTITDGKSILEPAIIERYNRSDEMFILRRLLRLKRDCANLLSSRSRDSIPPNELVWTNDFFAASLKKIRRKCQIRFYSMEEAISGQVPRPYNQSGVGDFWYISSSLVNGHVPELQPLASPFPGPMQQGFDPKVRPPWKPLQGLSLFSGGGGLDRGLEEGGAVRFKTAVDIMKEAVLTQKANAQDPHQLCAFHASVNTILEAAITGRSVDGLLRVYELIAAGTPCPGFSTLQKDPFGDKSLRNASLVTTFLSFIDIYRPQYAFLENVTNIARIRNDLEETKVLSSLISCLVSMGYQVKQFVLDAWNYGSIQRRSRLFLCVTAPGLTPIAQPAHSHSHYAGVSAHSLGGLPNGQKFAQREDYPTPFPHRTVAEAFQDLPDIGAGVLQACIPFPDHRLNARQSGTHRAIMERIPAVVSAEDTGRGVYVSHGPDFFAALQLGLIPDGLNAFSSTKETNSRSSKRFRRIKPDGLAPTITTKCNPHDSRTGAIVHWLQPRPFSIQEARETQGIPRHEVIIGNTEKQWKIIGNGVDRNPTLVLGLGLRDAVVTNNSRDNQFDLPTAPKSVTLERELEVIDLESDMKTLYTKVESFENGTWTSIPPEDQIQMTLRADTEADVRRRRREVASLPSPPESSTASGLTTPTQCKRVREEDTEQPNVLPAKRMMHSGLQSDPSVLWSRRIAYALEKSQSNSKN